MFRDFVASCKLITMSFRFHLCIILFLASAVVICASQLRTACEDGTPQVETRKADHQCPPLKVQHGRVWCRFLGFYSMVMCHGTMKPYTTAVITCNPDYKPVGGSQPLRLTCLSNGTWDAPVFKCSPACGVPKEAVQDQPLLGIGNDSHVGPIPWHAGVYHRQINSRREVYWEQKCGGSLITERFVLTAAHCVSEINEKDVAIALGKYYRSWSTIEPTEIKRNVSKIICPPEFSKVNFAFDFALVLLDRPIEFGENVMPVCHGFMARPKDIQDKPLFIVGWSKATEISGRSNEVQLFKNVSLVDQKKWQEIVPPFYPNFDKICTTNNNTDVYFSQMSNTGGGITVVKGGRHYILGVSNIQFQEYILSTNVSWHYHLTWIQDQIRTYEPTFKWQETVKRTTDFYNEEDFFGGQFTGRSNPTFTSLFGERRTFGQNIQLKSASSN